MYRPQILGSQLFPGEIRTKIIVIFYEMKFFWQCWFYRLDKGTVCKSFLLLNHKVCVLSVVICAYISQTPFEICEKTNGRKFPFSASNHFLTHKGPKRGASRKKKWSIVTFSCNSERVKEQQCCVVTWRA